jgi:hypothetical protein
MTFFAMNGKWAVVYRIKNFLGGKMKKYNKVITLLTVLALTVAALPVTSIANLAPILVSATSVSSNEDDVITITTDGNPIDSATYDSLLSALNAGKKSLNISGTFEHITTLLSSIGEAAFITNDQGAKTLLGALNKVENLKLDVQGDAVISPEAIAYISFLKREAVTNSTVDQSNLKTLTIDVNGEASFSPKTVQNDDIPATISEAITGLGLATDGSGTTLTATDGITLPEGENDVATFFGGNAAIVKNQTVTADGGNGATYQVADDGTVAIPSLVIDAETVDLNDANTVLNSNLAALATDASIVVSGSMDNIRALLTNFAAITDSAAKSGLAKIKTVNLAVTGDATIIPNDLAYINYLKNQISESVLSELNINVTGSVNFGAKTGSDTNIPDKISENVTEGITTTLGATGAVNLENGTNIADFFGNAKLVEGTTVNVGDVPFTINENGDADLTELTIDAASVNETELNSKLANLAKNAKLTINGNLEQTRNLLIQFAQLTGTDAVAGLKNIQTLDLNLSDDNAVIKAADLAYVKYLKNKLADSSLTDLNIRAEHKVSFDGVTADDIAAAVSEISIEKISFGANDVVTLPSGSDISEFFENIQLVKGTKIIVDNILSVVPDGDGTPQVTAPNFSLIKAHIQNVGDKTYASGSNFIGTTGQGLRLESISLGLADGIKGISYRVHVQNQGWTAWSKDGEAAGTRGKSLRIEAIEIKLSDKLDKQYDVYYRVHVQNQGTQGWRLNGDTAGTTGKSLRLEALQVVLVKKVSELPKSFG